MLLQFSQNMDPRVTIGLIGNAIALLLFLSPADTFWRIIKRGSTEEFESIPYTVLLLNASLWTYYGIIKPVVLLITINSFGAFVAAIYVSIFIIYAPPRMRAKTARMVAIMNVGFLVGVILVTSWAMDREGQVNTTGVFCVFVTILSYGSPLASMKTVIATKSVEFMPFYLTLANFLAATTWSIYGMLAGDSFILVPNVVGIFLGAAQLILYAWYKNYPKPSKITESLLLEEGSLHEYTVPLKSAELTTSTTKSLRHKDPTRFW